MLSRESDFSIFIPWLMKELAINAKTLASLVGVPHSSLLNWKYGANTPNPWAMMKLGLFTHRMIQEGKLTLPERPLPWNREWERKNANANFQQLRPWDGWDYGE